MIKVDYENCTGCGACVQKCPKNCISWKEEKLGFLYPSVDEEMCINCGLCESVCPIGQDITALENQKAYAVVHEKANVLLTSTSGGAFSVLADYVLSQDGIVYGASMDNNLQVEHIRIAAINELDQLKGSKYVQSTIGETFKQAEKDLKAGKEVLYVGTPCQITGLYRFLGTKYDNLITADIVCHGVGSQAYFDRFVQYFENSHGKITDIQFRMKSLAGWSCGGGYSTTQETKNILSGEGYKKFYSYNNYYYYYFLHGDIYRESCYSCKYANTDRPGDFTLGDFWGVEALKLSLNTADGCSLLLVNNSKARLVFEKLSDMKKVEVPLDSAVRHNAQLNHPSEKSPIRQRLSDEFDELSGNEINIRFHHNQRISILKGRLRTLIPYRIKRQLRKYL